MFFFFNVSPNPELYLQNVVYEEWSAFKRLRTLHLKFVLHFFFKTKYNLIS